jgi:peptide/nickel transport system ATP-binding protein
MSELVLSDLTVRYDSFTAVDRANLTVGSGKVLGLVGESGSGKSTIARAIVALTPTHGGSIAIDGQRVDTMPVRRRTRAMRRVQMIFQDPKSALDPRFTIAQCIEEALSPARSGAPPAKRRERVRALLERVALDPGVMDSRPGRLSGGQQQRVAIARALAADPAILIADEVTASLDVSVQAVILNLLRDIQRDTGLAMLFISHNLAVVRYMADEVAVMYRGRIVEQGPTGRIIGSPQDPYTVTLLEAVPRPGQRLEAGMPEEPLHNRPVQLPVV